jgi:hypothetical protein
MTKKRHKRVTRPCPHCGYVKSGFWTYNQRHWHLNRCKDAHPAERLYYKIWEKTPAKRDYPLWALRQMDPDLAIEVEKNRDYWLETARKTREATDKIMAGMPRVVEIMGRIRQLEMEIKQRKQESRRNGR